MFLGAHIIMTNWRLLVSLPLFTTYNKCNIDNSDEDGDDNDEMLATMSIHLLKYFKMCRSGGKCEKTWEQG